MSFSAPLPGPEPTISDVEKLVQNGLEALRNAPFNEQIRAALKFLTPDGYRPVAQLEEDGRKKRNNAAASNWNPETGEIVIYFERNAPESSSSVAAGQPEPQASSSDGKPMGDEREYFARLHRQVHAGLQEDPLLIPAADRSRLTREHIAATLAEPKVGDQEIEQLCMALAEAEKAGKAFISLTWFRDQKLTTHGYSWAESPAYRRAVFAKAFDAGAIVTSSIPNPKAPQHPTTTIKLNRESSYARTVTPRYQPIRAVGGASASEIVLRDRRRF